MKRMVRVPASRRARSASAMISRRSRTPAETAESVAKCERVWRAMTRARLVLPLPGGPQKMQEGTLSASIARRSGASSSSRWRWPTHSSRLRGRIRAASGASACEASSGWKSACWLGLLRFGIVKVPLWSDQPSAVAAALLLPAEQQHFGAPLRLFPGALRVAELGDLIGVRFEPGGLRLVGAQFADHRAAQQR